MRARQITLVFAVLGLGACLLYLRAVYGSAPPTLAHIGTVRLGYHPDLLIADWEIDDMFSFADTTHYLAWNMRTQKEMRGTDYEIEATKILGIMRPYRKHQTWDEAPADLKASVTKSLAGLVPSHATITDVYFAPHKDRLAWRVTFWNAPPLVDLLGRWLPAYQRLSRPIVQLWITDGTGNKPQVVGMQEGEEGLGFMEPSSKGVPGHPLIHGVVWSPREDLLGFILKDVFYTVPVPKQNQ